jgi:outer membrane lipopolysaccharide assembly protein LptE/RlpB
MPHRFMMNPFPHRSCWVLILLCLLLSGCGYAFRPKTEGMQKVEVLTFANETFKSGLEVAARDLLLQRLARRKFPVATASDADCTLKGTITRYSTDPVAFDTGDISRQYRLTISINAALKDRRSGKTVWEETLSAIAYYYTGPNVAATEIAERHGSARALDELSDMLSSRLTEDF